MGAEREAEVARWVERCDGGWTHPNEVLMELNLLWEVADRARAYVEFQPAEGSAGRHAAWRALGEALAEL